MKLPSVSWGANTAGPLPLHLKPGRCTLAVFAADGDGLTGAAATRLSVS